MVKTGFGGDSASNLSPEIIIHVIFYFNTIVLYYVCEIICLIAEVSTAESLCFRYCQKFDLAYIPQIVLLFYFTVSINEKF